MIEHANTCQFFFELFTLLVWNTSVLGACSLHSLHSYFGNVLWQVYEKNNEIYTDVVLG